MYILSIQDLRLVAKADHRHDKRSLDSSLMLRLNKNALESSLKLADKSKDLTDMSGEFTLNYPGKKVAATQTISESKDHQFNSSMTLRIGKSMNSIVTSWKRSSPTSLMVGSSINIQNMDPIDIKGEYSLGPETYIGRGFFTKGKSTYGAAFMTDMSSDTLQVTTDLMTPSRKIMASVDGSKSGDKYTSRVDIRLDAEKDDANRIVLTGSGNFPSKNDIEGSMTLQYPGRTLAMNIKNIAKGKFISHMDFQWESGKVIAIDTSFGDVTKMDMREVTGDVKLRTPFTVLRTLDLSMNQQIQPSQYVTSMDIEWNPKQIISSTLTLKRPMSLKSFHAELLAKTPAKSMKTVQVTLSHRLDDNLASTIAAKWNKQSAQADVSLTKMGNSNIKGQVDIKTSFNDFKNGGVTFSYLNNQMKKSAEMKLIKNKDIYSIASEMNHNVNGYNVRNSGSVKVNAPEEIFSTVWDHSNTLNDVTSTGTVTYKDNRVALKYTGHQDMGVSAGNMRSSLEIQSTFSPIRDIMVTMDHEHKQGLIDSTIKVSKDGDTLVSADAKYTRDNGKVIGVFKATTPFSEDDLSAKIDSAYLSYPMTGRVELSASPVLTAVLDGSVMVSNGDIDSSLQLKFPYIDPINIKFGKLMEDGDIKTKGSMEYAPGKQMSYESKYRNDRIKKLQLIVTPPTAKSMIAEVELQGSMETFRVQGKLSALPLINTWSAVGTWDSRDSLGGNLRINTPYRNVSYVQISAESSKRDGERQSVITIEYMPRKEIKLISVYNLMDPKDMKMTMKLTTPFTMLPYASAGFSHKGDLQQFSNQAEIEYQAGKRLTAESEFSRLRGLSGSAKVTSPFSSDMVGSFSHNGDMKNFHSRAEATWGTTSAIDIKHETNNNNFKSNMEVSMGTNKYEGEMIVERSPTYSAELTLKTPIKYFENTKIAQTLDGTYKQFSSHSEISNSYTGKYSTDIRMNLNRPMSGEISIQSPVKGYRNMRTAFTHDGSLTIDGSFATHVEAELNGQQVSGDMKLSSKPIISFETTVKTPMKDYKLSRISYTHDGSFSDFKCHGEIQRNKDISEADLSVKASKKIDIDLSVRSPYMDTLKVSLDHWGSLKKFTTNLRAKQGKQKGSASIKFQLNPTFNTMIALKTPFSYLKNQQLTLKHAGDLNSFKCNMQYKCNGKTYIGDASFDSTNSLNGQFNLKGSGIKPVAVILTHTGPLRKFQSSGEVSYGKQKMQVDASLNTVDELSGKLSVISPLDAFNKMTVMMSHSGPLTNFKTHGEVALDRKKGQFDASFSSADNIEGSLSIQTPFRGVEDISASVTHMGDLQDFNTIAKYGLNKKAVEGRIGFVNGPVMTGAASLRSSFPYIDNYEASFRHENNGGAFKTHGEVDLAGQKHEADVEFNKNNGYSGSINVNSPSIRDTEVAFRHSLTDKSLDSNAYITYGGEKKINVVAYGSVDPAISGNLKIETPVGGFENTELSVYHDGPLNNFRSHGEVTFRGEKSEADVEYSALSGVSAKMSVKSPMTKNINSEFSYRHDGNGVKTSAEGSYGGQTAKGTVSLRYNPDISGDISLDAPFMKPLELSVEHTGPMTNCKTTAEYKYDGEPKMNWDSNFAMQSGNINSGLNVKSTIPGYRRFGGSVQHTGGLSNFKTTTEAYCDESVHKGEISFSPKEGKLTIESPLMRPINIDYTVEGDLSDFRSQGKIEFGNNRLVDASVNANSNAGDLTLSVEGLKTIHMSYTNRGTVRRFTSRGEMSYGGNTVEGDISFNSIDNLEGSVGLRLPTLRPLSASFKYDGEPMNFQSHGEIALGSDKHEVDTSFNMKGDIEGSFTAMSPLIKTVAVSFRTTKDITDHDSNAKVHYDNEKILDISTTWTLQPITASLTVITPTNMVKSNFNFNGQVKKFQSAASVNVNGQSTKVDASLNLVDELNGKLEVSTPSMYPASIGFNCDSRSTTSKCSAAVDFQSKKHTAEASLSMNSIKEGILSVNSPFIGSYSGKASFEGSMNRFRSSAEFKANEKKGSVEITTSIYPGDVDIHVSASTPFKNFETNNAGFTLTHSGSAKNFKGTALLTYNKNKVEIDGYYNIETAMEGSLSVKTPFTKDFNIAFDKSGSTLTSSMNYDSETIFSTEGSFSKMPLRGSMKVELPFTTYKTISGAFSHDGTALKSTNHAEITINEETTEADMSFNFGSKLEGSVSLKSPYMEDMTTGFDFSGTTSNFRSHVEMQYGANKYAVDSTLNANNDIDGEVTITTPFKGYRNINGKLTYSGKFPFINGKVQLSANRRNLAIAGVQLSNSNNKLTGSASFQSVVTPNIEVSFNHQGDLLNFASDAEVRYNGQSNTGSVSFKTSPSVEGAMSLSLPAFLADDMSSNFKFEGSLQDFKLNIEDRLGKKVISTEVTFTTLRQIALSASIKTPFADFEDISGGFYLKEKYGGYTAHMELDLGARQKSEIDMSYTFRQSLKGSVLIKSPYSVLRYFKADLSHSGSLPAIRSGLTLSNSDKEYTFELNIEELTPSMGKVTISTPFEGYESTVIEYNNRGQFPNLYADAKVTCFRGNEISASFQNTISGNKLDTKATLITPYTEDLQLEIVHNGPATDFTNMVTLSMGPDNSFTASTTLKSYTTTFDFDTTISTMFAGYSNEQKATAKFDGSLENFKTSTYVKVLGNEFSGDAAIQSQPSLDWKLSLKTPIQNLRDIQLSLEHSGDLRRFSSKAEVQYAPGEKIEGTVSYSRYGWRRLQSSVEVRTPFSGFERSSASYIHSASVDSFECNADMTIVNKDFSGTFKAAKSPLSGSLVLKTPFENFDDLSASMKLESDAAEASVTYMKDKTITLKSEKKFDISPKSASVKLTTPFEGFESSELKVEFAGDMKNFQTSVTLDAPIVNTMKLQTNLQSSSLASMSGSMSFNSEINSLENLSLNFRNRAYQGRYSTRVETSWAPGQEIVLDSSMRINEREQTGKITLTTPFSVVRQLEYKTDRQMSTGRYQETSSVSYNNKIISDYDIAWSMDRGFQLTTAVRQPVPYSLELSGRNDYGKYSGLIAANWDTNRSDKNVRIEGDLDMNNDYAYNLKYKCPTNDITATGSVGKSNSKMDLSLNGVHYGYDSTYSNKDLKAKLMYPSRSIEVFGGSDSKTTEGYIAWDADRDETKKIGMKAVLVPTGDSMKADISVMMPSIGKVSRISNFVLVFGIETNCN